MTDLHEVIAAHKAKMAAYEAIPDEDWDELSDGINDEIEVTRQAVLDMKCATLEEVRTKAEFMLSCISFSVWDDLDPKELITAFVPEVIQ